MTKKISLSAISREVRSGELSRIKYKGLIPGVIYGYDFLPKAVSIKKHDLELAYNQAGESSLITLQVDDATPIRTLIKEIQRDRMNGNIQHVDFYVVNMKKAIEVEVPLHFVGEAKAEKELGGFLVKDRETLHVSCLPGDLVENIEVNIEPLQTFDAAIKIKDLIIPEELHVLADPEEMVAHVIEPKVVEEEVPVVAPEPTTAEGEGTGKIEEKVESDKEEARAK